MENENPRTGKVQGFDLETPEQPFNTSNSFQPSMFPPGLVGEIAQFIFDAAPRPVWEIALAGAIGFMAGICGRAFNICGSALNQYIIVIADTGRGKEAISSGIAKLKSALLSSSPTIVDYEGPGQIASSQALSKWLARTPCIYSIVGEFGIKLRQMSAENASPHLALLKADLLSLYHKGDWGNVWGAMAYAKRDDNIAAIKSPAFTLIGESTPSKFYENVDEDVVTDGLLPRFTMFTYEGDQVPLNSQCQFARPAPELVQTVGSLVAQTSAISARDDVQNVEMSPQAKTVLDAFEAFARHAVNNRDPQTGLKLPATASGVVTELYNRAHVKALRLAAVLAVGVDYIHPCVNEQQAQWACNEIRAQTRALIARFSTGEVGAAENNENIRRANVIKTVFHYATTPFNQLPKYGAIEEMHRLKIIPKSYLSRCLCDTAAFRKAHGGATRALDTTIRNLRSSCLPTGHRKPADSQGSRRDGVHAGRSICHCGSLLEAACFPGTLCPQNRQTLSPLKPKDHQSPLQRPKCGQVGSATYRRR